MLSILITDEFVLKKKYYVYRESQSTDDKMHRGN